MKRPITSRVPPVTAILVRIAIIPMMALPACSALAGPTVAPERATPAPATQATTFSVSGTQSPAAAGSPSPVGTNAPSATPNEHETLKAIYNSHATTVAAAGDRTLVPYETSAAQGTRFAAEQTQYVENQNTPTPFGPLPFPGTRLTDAELAQRGWPRMKEDGQRNNDYRTSAIWLDKAYVDAEIFSKYQALFDLLAFRDGPPGDDFEARLGELMILSDVAESALEKAIQADADNSALATCDYASLLTNVLDLKAAGAYLTFLPDPAGRKLGWRWDNRTPIRETYEDLAIGYQVGADYFVLLDTTLQRPNRTPNSLSVDFQTRAVFDERELLRWYDSFDPTQSDANVMLVWKTDAESWMVYKFASPYCGNYYPRTIQR